MIDLSNVTSKALKLGASRGEKLENVAADVIDAALHLDDSTRRNPDEAGQRAKLAIAILQGGTQAVYGDLDPDKQWLIDQILTGALTFEKFTQMEQALQNRLQPNVIDITPTTDLQNKLGELMQAVAANEAAVRATVTAVTAANTASMGSKGAKITAAAGTTAAAANAATAVNEAANLVQQSVNSLATNPGPQPVVHQPLPLSSGLHTP